MQQFINELNGAHRSHQYVTGDTVLTLTAQAARDLITCDIRAQRYVAQNEKDAWISRAAP